MYVNNEYIFQRYQCESTNCWAVDTLGSTSRGFDQVIEIKNIDI